MTNKLQVATLGGGCFWCLEAIFSELQGVEKITPGYAGGTTENPNYEQVCTGTTGHAEVIQVEYDPGIITYPELLEVFIATHDPTTLNKQGVDIGTQYRSVIFYHDEEQRKQAEAILAQTQTMWDDPIVTELVAFSAFYPAEDYHFDYFKRNPQKQYCAVVINPKVAKFRKKFADKLSK